MKDLEIKELYKVLEEQWGDSDNYINYLIRYSKEQDRRINKAIEYINKNGIIDLNGYDLLEILKGSDKE